MFCLHTLTNHQTCTCSHSLLSLFFSACNPDISEININDFCPSCREFWDEESISETARRELAQSFRIANAYHGELTPVKDGLSVVTFRMEGVMELDQQVSSDAASMVTVTGMDDDVMSVCMLNAQYHWLVAGDRALDEAVEVQEQGRKFEQQHSGPEQEQESEMVREPEQESAQSQSPRSRRGSNSSTLTIWPSGFDEIPMFETDEFGIQVEVPSIAQPVAAHLA